MKTCKTCLLLKPLLQFRRCDRSSGGHKTVCKKCESAGRMAWMAANPEATAAIRSRYSASPARKAAQRRYAAKNVHYYRAKAIEREAAAALPAWAKSEWEEFFIRECYDLAAKRTRVTGIGWHVDHIVPLRGRGVCGLHCAANLQVIPAADNLRKSNRLLAEHQA